MESVAVVLGRRIRKLRERKGLTQTELARLVLSSKTAISDYELGNRAPDLNMVQRLEEVLETDGQLIELSGLLELGEQDSATVADVEQDALGMTVWEMRVIPGLLQTPAYMRAALSTSLPPDKVERELAIRRQRQKVVSGLVAGWFILSEAVLRLVYGDDTVMRDQLLALEATAAMPGISVQVMPFRSTRHTGGDGPLSVIEYRDRAAIWFTEGRTSGRMSTDRTEVMQATYALNTIRAAALPVHESVEFIRNLRETTYEQPMA